MSHHARPPSLLSYNTFDAILTEIVLLIYFFDCLFLAYSNTTDFYVLILYPGTLLNSFMSFNRFFVESLGFSIAKIMSSVNKAKFTSLFSIWKSFISFSCSIAVARTSFAIGKW